MARIDRTTITKYQEALKRDPASKLFAPLAEAYRELGMLQEAEKIARDGIQRHPQYVGGYIALGRILIGNQQHEAAVEILEKAIQLSADNLLAYQLLGESYLQLNRPKDALKAHKMALFLNPMSLRSKQAIEKLESLSADEFEQDVFEMKSLPKNTDPARPAEIQRPGPTSLNRQLSLLDALIVRQDFVQAKRVLNELRLLYPTSPDVLQRWEMLNGGEPIEQASQLSPTLERQKYVLQNKINRLRQVLKAIEGKRLAFPD